MIIISLQMLVKALISYVLDKLKDVCSASLESGFQRLLDKFHAFYAEEKTKEIGFALRESLDKDN